MDFKKAYDSARREVPCNIFMQFGMSMELVGRSKMKPIAKGI
jgi:hypothetical protein